MTDEPTGDRSAPDDHAGSPTESTGPDVDVDAVLAYLKWGALIALGLLAVVAGVGIYTSVSAIIEVWIADRYQPLARAAFNFAVLFVAVAGIFALLRRV